jgi:predicted RNA-binding protein with PUA-like domain
MTLLLKTEPSTYSFADLVRDRSTVWNGVTNPAACKNLRNARKGDTAFIYHTGDERCIVGLATLASDPYPDPKDPSLTKEGVPARPVVDLKAGPAVQTPLSLAEMKADPRFKEFELLRLSRLSVVPVPADIERLIRQLTGTAPRNRR